MNIISLVSLYVYTNSLIHSHKQLYFSKPLDVAAARPFEGMKKPVTLGGTTVSSLPQARGQVPPGGPNPCTNIPRRGDGHCSK
ncbi:unnamed protein product [Prunus armeniaca]|uniref:Uncharacterized protein n=1 Tax=Prunus armeniaca TaxID=36596 RepID=A0A6J5VVJ4_PRUAR|nr:unnamed protein product [Prunus armeniaca]